MEIYSIDGSYFFVQSVINGVFDGHCFSAMNWLGSPEFGSLIIIPTVIYTHIELLGLYHSLLHNSLQREYTVTLLAERENNRYYEYDLSSFFANIPCFLNVMIVSLSDKSNQTTIFVSLLKAVFTQCTPSRTAKACHVPVVRSTWGLYVTKYEGAFEVTPYHREGLAHASVVTTSHNEQRFNHSAKVGYSTHDLLHSKNYR